MRELRDSDDPADRALARLIEEHSSKGSNVAAHKREGRERAERIDAQKQVKQAQRAQQAEAKAASKDALASAHKTGSIWELTEIDEIVQGIQGASDKIKAVGEQLCFYKAILSSPVCLDTAIPGNVPDRSNVIRQLMLIDDGLVSRILELACRPFPVVPRSGLFVPPGTTPGRCGRKQGSVWAQAATITVTVLGREIRIVARSHSQNSDPSWQHV